MATNETKVVPIRPGPPWDKHPTPWRYEDGDIIDANGDSVEVSISQLRHLVAAINAHGPMREALEAWDELRQLRAVPLGLQDMQAVIDLEKRIPGLMDAALALAQKVTP